MPNEVFVPIIIDSERLADYAQRAVDALGYFGIGSAVRAASGHKSPGHLLMMLRQYEDDGRAKVYITISERTDTLSGMVDATVAAPVIACLPPHDDGLHPDAYASLHLAGGVSPGVVLEPEAAAFLAAKVLGLVDSRIATKVQQRQQAQTEVVVGQDKELRGD